MDHAAPQEAPVATPTTSPAALASLAPVGQLKSAAAGGAGPGLPLVQAVYTDQTGQPLYIVQHMNQPTLIPIQPAAATAGGGAAAVTSAPSSLKIEAPKQPSLTLQTPPPSELGRVVIMRGRLPLMEFLEFLQAMACHLTALTHLTHLTHLTLAAVHVGSPGGPKSVLANTFTPPKLDSLIQPASTRLIPIPHVNGGSFQSLSVGEGPGPIRSHTRQAARERPSPVAYDGG